MSHAGREWFEKELERRSASIRYLALNQQVSLAQGDPRKADTYRRLRLQEEGVYDGVVEALLRGEV
jgi:hypothetical protein